MTRIREEEEECHSKGDASYCAHFAIYLWHYVAVIVTVVLAQRCCVLFVSHSVSRIIENVLS